MNPQARKRPQLSLTMDPDLVEQAKDAAWRSRTSLSAYVEQALRSYMEQNPPPEAPVD